MKPRARPCPRVSEGTPRGSTATSLPREAPTMLIGCTAYSVRDYFKAGEIHCRNFAGIMSELGIEALEYHQMFFESWESDYLAEIRKSAEDVGLPIVCLGCAGGFCQDDPAQRREDIEVIRDRLLAASALGARCIRVQLGRTGTDETDSTVGVQRSIDALNELIPTAKERGIRIALENHAGVASRANWILRIILGTDPDWVGACPDLGNFPREVRYRETGPRPPLRLPCPRQEPPLPRQRRRARRPTSPAPFAWPRTATARASSPSSTRGLETSSPASCAPRS